MLKQIAQIVMDVAKKEVMPRYLKVGHSQKQDGSLFTEADVACQNTLIQELTQLANYPVMGEEMSDAEHQAAWQAGEEGMWCLDPIDGTSNFVNGIAYFAVSVALMRHGRTVMGVIYDPVANELFCAEAGRGATLNGISLPITQHDRVLRQALAGISFKNLPNQIKTQIALKPPYCSHRNFGASTLDWCYLAAGRLDVYLHGGQKMWDYAAGALILQEAGGAFSTLNQVDFWQDIPGQRSVVAARNPNLHTAWRSWINGVED